MSQVTEIPIASYSISARCPSHPTQFTVLTMLRTLTCHYCSLTNLHRMYSLDDSEPSLDKHFSEFDGFSSKCHVCKHPNSSADHRELYKLFWRCWACDREDWCGQGSREMCECGKAVDGSEVYVWRRSKAPGKVETEEDMEGAEVVEGEEVDLDEVLVEVGWRNREIRMGRRRDPEKSLMKCLDCGKRYIGEEGIRRHKAFCFRGDHYRIL